MTGAGLERQSIRGVILKRQKRSYLKAGKFSNNQIDSYFSVTFDKLITLEITSDVGSSEAKPWWSKKQVRDLKVKLE